RGRAARGPHDEPVWNRVARDEIDVAATSGDDDGAAEAAAEQGRRHSGRVEVVRVDDVEVMATIPDLPEGARRRGGEEKRRGAHAHLGHEGEARMAYVDPVERLPAWCLRYGAVAAESLPGGGEPRHGRHHDGSGSAAGKEMAQPRLHEDPVPRPRRAWIERR